MPRKTGLPVGCSYQREQSQGLLVASATPAPIYQGNGSLTAPAQGPPHLWKYLRALRCQRSRGPEHKTPEGWKGPRDSSSPTPSFGLPRGGPDCLFIPEVESSLPLQGSASALGLLFGAGKGGAGSFY